MRMAGVLALGICMASGLGQALAAPPFNCAGAALEGGAELLCSHVGPDAAPLVCSFSWTLMATTGQPSVVNGSFLLPAGAQDAIVYQGSGYTYALSTPVVLCQGRAMANPG